MPESNPKFSISKLVHHPNFAILLLVGFYVILGMFIDTHYGESWDEKARYKYGVDSLSAYVGAKVDLVDEKGSFFSMLGVLGAEVFKRVFPGWITIDGWHYVTFLAYAMGVYFFYRLCRRLVEPVPAFAATLLFSTQPLLWGHGFINPKDAPFMAFFMASVSLGLDMVDHFREKEKLGQNPSWKERITGLPRTIAGSWKTASRWARITLGVLSAAFAGLILAYPSMARMIIEGVEDAYHGSPTTLLGQIFIHFMSSGNLSPAEYYTSKAQMGFSWAFLGAEFALLVLIFMIARLIFPKIIDDVAIAGVFLGLCSDIRTLGPASGLLVVVYFLFKSRLKAVPTLLKYLATAAVTAYIFWPNLWGSPLSSYIASMSEAKDFPWDGIILFQGIQYNKTNLPASFLPTMISIQFTEPAMILFAIGFVLACIYLIRKAELRMDLLLLGAWFVAPIVAAIVAHSTIYNNFRQFLFTIPPLFILAALALQWLWSLLKKKMVWFALVALIAVAPGVYWDVALHPFEYIYYNSLVGGVSGSFRNYESDYWCTAYKDATKYVNEVAPQGATIAVSGPYEIMATYARPDLNFIVYTADSDKKVDYAIISSKWNHDLYDYADKPIVYKIIRDDAILVVVREVVDHP